MSSRTRSASWAWSTLDVVLSTLGMWLALFPAVAVTNDLLGWVGVVGFPVVDETLYFVVGVVALGGAYPFVTGDWSLGRLGEFVLALTACIFAAGLLGAVVILAGGLTINDGNPLPQVVGLACAYVAAYWLVYRGGYAGLKRAAA